MSPMKLQNSKSEITLHKNKRKSTTTKTNKKHLVCNQCGQQFRLLKNFNKHKIVSCVYKQKQPKSKAVKKMTFKETEQVKTVKERQYFNCDNCTAKFITPKQLQIHKRTHDVIRTVFNEEPTHNFVFEKAQGIYVCTTCCAEFQDSAEAQKHMEAVGKTHVCTECGQKFETKYDLGCHMSVHDEKGLVHCPLCPTKCTNAQTLRRHIKKVHFKVFKYNCDKCGRGFSDARYFEQHQNIHAGIKPYQCVVCEKSFSMSKSLFCHQLREHTVALILKVKCDYCDKTFNTEEEQYAHMQIHYQRNQTQKGKVFLCDTCGKSFNKRGSLTGHERIHTGAKPFDCTVCSRPFRLRSQLSAHLRVHTGEKPYACEFCGKGFKVKYKLTTHIRIHTGERPFTCKYCGKTFRQDTPYSVHLRTHTGERPYVCLTCKKGFITNQGLKAHKKNCTGVVGHSADEDDSDV